MTNDEILQQLVTVVMPKLVSRVKAVESNLEELSAKLAALEEAAAKPKMKRTRRKKSEILAEKEAAEEAAATAEIEQQMTQAAAPIDLTLDDIEHFDSIRQLGVTDPNFAANVYGVDAQKYAVYLSSVTENVETK